jgi:hypothetical protein
MVLKPLVTVCLLVLLFADLRCSQGRNEPSTMQKPDSLLQRDLTSDSRDAIYRALSFIARNGGPKVPVGMLNLAQWKQAARPSLAWLQDQSPERVNEMEARYKEYIDKWSPSFTD